MVVGLIGQTSVFSQVSLHWRGEEKVRIIDTWLKTDGIFFYHSSLSTRACDKTNHRAGSQLKNHNCASKSQNTAKCRPMNAVFIEKNQPVGLLFESSGRRLSFLAT